MNFRALDVAGAYAIDVELHSDERGFFARAWSGEQFKAHGLNSAMSEVSFSHNLIKGTLRGLHLQMSPHAEAKLVRCTRGGIFDVAVDLRPSSPTFKKFAALLLNGENHTAMYIPEGCAHGFLTLTDDSEVLYLISHPYVPEYATGVRWNDPAFGIQWPAEPVCISDRDRNYPNFAG